jgi:hypothetical protein
MKAVVYERYGGPGVLRVEDVPTPTPAGGQVLVKIAATLHQPQRLGRLVWLTSLRAPGWSARAAKQPRGAAPGLALCGAAVPVGIMPR